MAYNRTVNDAFYRAAYEVISRKTYNKFDPHAGVQGSNKFFVLELHSSPLGFRVYLHYGKNGTDGQKQCMEFSSLRSAEQEFARKHDERIHKKGYVPVDVASYKSGDSYKVDQNNLPNGISTAPAPVAPTPTAQTPNAQAPVAQAPAQPKMSDAIKADSFYQGPFSVHSSTTLVLPGENRFYTVEIHINPFNGYRVFSSSGVIGNTGRQNSTPMPDGFLAKDEYTKRIRAMKKKGYIVRTLPLSAATQPQSTSSNKTISAMTPAVSLFLDHIFSEANRAVSQALKGTSKASQHEMKTSLGNLSITSINKGRDILNRISSAMQRNAMSEVERLSIDYFNYIPRDIARNLRSSRDWVLDTDAKLLREMDVLELYEDTLRNIHIMSSSPNITNDTRLSELKCDIEEVLDKDLCSKIANYIVKSKAPNHSFNLKVGKIFKVNQKAAPVFDASVGNVKVLYHGSRNANMVGLLSSYLKVPYALSGVSKTGALFGDGIYFADSATKSAQYSFGGWSGVRNQKNVSYLLVCSVALGNVHKAQSGFSGRKAPQGYDSVMGVAGKTRMNSGMLRNNEFIVYDSKQVRVDFVVEIEQV